LAKKRRLKAPIPAKKSGTERARSSGEGLGLATTRLMRGKTVIMTKTTNGEQRDVAGDIADAVGTAIGGIVNELEKLEARKGELLEQLRKASQTVTANLDKYLPGVKDMPRKAKESFEKARKTLDKPCSICGFKTKPYHDGRLKIHRDQGEKKKPLTDTQLAELEMKKV
jgi:hypothetical protein